MPTTPNSFDIPENISKAILHCLDISLLREALIHSETHESSGLSDSAKAELSTVLDGLGEQAIRMLVLEAVAMNNSPGARLKSGLKVDREGRFTVSEKGIIDNKNLEPIGNERGI